MNKGLRQCFPQLTGNLSHIIMRMRINMKIESVWLNFGSRGFMSKLEATVLRCLTRLCVMIRFLLHRLDSTTAGFYLSHYISKL